MAAPDVIVRPDRMGRSLTWLCGGALAFNLLLVVGLLVLLAWEGLGTFWPRPLERFVLADGRRVLGEVHERRAAIPGSGQAGEQIKVKVGNRDLTGRDFEWIDAAQVRESTVPEDAVLLERREWGSFLGSMVELRRGDEVLAAGPESTWRRLQELHPLKEDQHARLRALEKGDLDEINRSLRELSWEKRRRERAEVSDEERRRAADRIDREAAGLEAMARDLGERISRLRQEHLAEKLVMEAADGRRQEIAVGMVVRAVRPNPMTLLDRFGLYLARLWEFVADEPRESNTEGGIFPAIFGTVLMVFLMALAVVPLGVLAALYLREYARQGPVVRIVRIAVNNLAGTPSIVFGVFGLGFFVYVIGGSIDQLFFAERLPTPTFGTGGVLWASLTLALLTVPVVIVATEEGLAAVPRIVREGSLALGATKWETLRKVVLPASTPAILTGMILAMGRAAGEVAPLMIVGMVKLADLPLDTHFPFLHLDQKFMHLGFHIYDVGFQSPNVEATKPLVATTALLLVAVVTLINLVAIRVRNNLRRRYAHSGV